MDEQFNSLNEEYQKAIKESKTTELNDLLEQMRDNILGRNNQNDYFKRTLDEKGYSISSSTYQDLLEINGEMNRIATSQNLTSISDNARETQSSKNKYGPNNPYPQE